MLMEEKTRFVVGLDVGTSTVRAVVGRAGQNEEEITIVGSSEVPSEGLRRGVVTDLELPAKAIDACLAKVGQASGVDVEAVTIGINGAHIVSTKVDGVVAVVAEHEINEGDLRRLDEVATAGKIPLNRRVLDLVPYEYILDGQGGIREPLGMHGMRLELRANVISALAPNCDNLLKACADANVNINGVMPSVVAAAQAVLTSRQRENGVGVVDLGGATTGVAIYDEGELQFTGVVPIGSNDITRDLATVLMTVPEVAEEIKLRFASAKFGDTEKDIVIKRGRDELVFARQEVDEVVEARLEEIFEGVRKLLKRADYDRRLPEGIVLVGGGAKMRDIDSYARMQLELAVRIGKPIGLLGVSEEVTKPEYAAAVGLMRGDRERVLGDTRPLRQGKKGKKGGGFFAGLFGMFR